MKKNKEIILLKSKEGLTLIELMVVVVILSFIILGLVTVFTGGTRSWISGQSQLKSQREARQAMDQIVVHIRLANSFTWIDGNLKIQIPEIKGESEDEITFSLSDGTLSMDGVPLLENVLSVEFVPVDSSRLNINLRVDGDDDGNPDIELSNQVRLRNFGT
jgi:prepilin-type N-terminal cleavage/methylation domain-containing protein